jgi:hypothetical protein
VSIAEDHPARAFYLQINADALIVDYGGLGLGCSGFTDSITRRLSQAIKDYPNTEFFLISQMLDVDVRHEIGNWLQSEGITDWPHNYHLGWEAFEDWFFKTSNIRSSS